MQTVQAKQNCKHSSANLHHACETPILSLMNWAYLILRDNAVQNHVNAVGHKMESKKNETLPCKLLWVRMLSWYTALHWLNHHPPDTAWQSWCSVSICTHYPRPLCLQKRAQLYTPVKQSSHRANLICSTSLAISWLHTYSLLNVSSPFLRRFHRKMIYLDDNHVFVQGILQKKLQLVLPICDQYPDMILVWGLCLISSCEFNLTSGVVRTHGVFVSLWFEDFCLLQLQEKRYQWLELAEKYDFNSTYFSDDK